MAAKDHGGRVSESMGIDRPPTVRAGLVQTADFAASWLQWDERKKSARIEFEQDNAFLIAMQRKPLASHPYWVDGRPVKLEPRKRGQFNLLDLRRNEAAEVHSAVDCISIYLPTAALDALAEEWRIGRVHTLMCEPGEAIQDPVLWHLCESLTPALARPDEANQLFVAHVGLSIGFHMIDRYAEFSRPDFPRSGGLAPWQERMAKELMMASIASSITLNELANACQLSRSHFARSFKSTTGVAPHQWLLMERIKQAKRLLVSSRQSIEQIADECGFADQSHFTRTFARAVRSTPAQWRRERRQ